MKNPFKILLLSIVGFLLLIAPASNAISKEFDLPIAAVSITLIVVAAIVVKITKTSNSPSAYANGVEVEVWVDYIIKRLFKDNAFLNHAFNDDQFVLAGKIVHIPQPGSKPTVVKNRSSFPATAVGRTDTDIYYPLDVYTTDPTHIQDAEKIELSYDKIDSVFGDHAGSMAETIADDMIIKWLTGIASGQIVGTTGGNVAATAPSATGNRKLILLDDMKKCQKLMNQQSIDKNDRYAMLSSEMLDQLTSNLTSTQYRDFSQYYNAAEGIVGKLYGFQILERSSVAVADNTNAVKALGAAGAIGDNEVALLWQKNAVARALGETKFFDNVNDPQYYGDVYSALVRMGGRRRRSDSAGVIQLTQAAGA